MFSKSNKKSFVLIQGLLLLFFVLNYLAHDISSSSVIWMFIYQLFAWYLTGRFIVSIFDIQARTYMEILSLSYTFGAISAVIFYFVFMTLKLEFFLPLFTVIEGSLSALYLHKTSNIDEYEVDGFGTKACLTFLVIYFSLSFCAVSLVNSFPNETAGGTGYYVDWPFWAGNNIAFTRGFPIDTFRQIGTEFKYHYFSSILMAQASLCTGIDINWITFYFSNILGGLILVLSGYYFASRFAKSKWLIFVTMMAALFTDGTTVTFTWHTNLCPFGFDYGYAFGMMSLALLAEIIKNNRWRELFIPSCLYIAMTTGCKGPIGVVILAAHGVAAFSYFLQKKIKKGIVSGLFWIISFLGVYIAVLHSPVNLSEESGLEYIGGLGLNAVVASARWISAIYKSILLTYRISGDYLLVKLYAVWLYIYNANNVVITFLLIAIVVMFFDLRKRSFDCILYCLFASAVVGILLAIYTKQSGGSQMYFMMGMFPAAIMAGGYALERMLEAIQTKNNISRLYIGSCIMVIFNLGISTNIYYETIMKKFQEGVAVARDTYEPKDYRDYYADGIDFEAFDWIKNNTAKDALIVTDSHTDIYGRSNSMIMGMFSQRFIWNEMKYVPDADEAKRRNNIVNATMSSPDKYLNIMREEGVDYFVYQLVPGKANYVSQCNMLSEVFRNSHYVIYKLNFIISE